MSVLIDCPIEGFLLFPDSQFENYFEGFKSLNMTGRHFSCLKGVDVIPCIENEELEEDPEVII